MLTPAYLCSRCGKRLNAHAVRTAGKQYHPACFFCDSCHQPLEKNLIFKGERLYHPACYERLFIPRCHHCGERIQDRYIKDTQGRYHPQCYQQLHQLICSLCGEGLDGSYLMDAWGQKAHPHHAQGPTGQCHVCARLMMPVSHQNQRQLADGRLLCAHCHLTEVQDFAQIQAAKHAVLMQLQAVGFDYLPEYIQIVLDENQQLLNERLRASATGNVHGFTQTRQRHIPGYGLIFEHSIHIMNGLPRLAFMGVLAHELLHVWLNERQIHHLSQGQVEGFCNLGTALIYQQASTSADRELAQVLLARMDSDPDPIYGDGYRVMASYLKKMGWSALLQALAASDRPLCAPQAEHCISQHSHQQLQPFAVPDKETPPDRLEKLAEATVHLQQIQHTSPGHPPHTRLAEPVLDSGTIRTVDPAIVDKVRARFAQARLSASQITPQTHPTKEYPAKKFKKSHQKKKRRE